jgi:hypothetical protein
MKIGATGHQLVPREALALWSTELRLLLARSKELIGVCSLAEGADQEFAALFLEHGAALEVVLPCHDYVSAFSSEEGRARFESLRNAALSVTVLPFPSPSEEAFLAGGLIVVERSETVVALWDGEDARGLGGTADIVRYAKGLGRQVTIVWPDGVRRGR